MGVGGIVSDSTQTAPAVAITGATGYLGRRVAERYRERGWRVVCLTRNAGTPDAIEFTLGQPLRAKSLRGVRALVHCAYDFSVVRKSDVARINVDGTRALFAAAAEAGVERLTYVSSISAFTGCASEYGKTKLRIEAIARDVGALVVRPGLIFAETPGAMYGKLVDQVAKLRLVPLIGDGSQIQFLVHRDDVTELLVRSGSGVLPSLGDHPVTVAHPRPWPMRELVQTIAQRMGRTPVLVPTPWRLVWAALKSAELLRLPIAFRSDSVVSLMNQDPAPDFAPVQQSGVVCRPFA